MEPGTAALLSDAIKILGPAVIVAWATYRASKAQLELKLKEIKSTQEFGAREHLFRYYKERQDQLGKEYAKIRDSLEGDVGLMEGLAEGSGGAVAPLDMMNEYTVRYCEIVSQEIDATLADMDKNGLAGTPDFDRLKSYKPKISCLQSGGDVQSLRRNIFVIVEAYHFLQLCNQKLLQRQMEKMFTKYLKV